MFTRRRFASATCAAGLLTGLLTGLRTASAQPAGTVKLVVGFAPGDTADVLARAVFARARECAVQAGRFFLPRRSGRSGFRAGGSGGGTADPA